MKQTNLRTFFKSTFWHAAGLALMLFSFVGVQQKTFSAVTTCTVNCNTCTLSNTFGAATYTLSYPSCVCVGDTFTVILTITVTQSYGDGGIIVQDFAPNPTVAGTTCPGLSLCLNPPFCTIFEQTGPNPPITGGTYLAADGMQHCGSTGGGGGPASSGQGQLTIPAGTGVILPGVPYTYTYNVLATAAGLQTWLPTGVSIGLCDVLFQPVILVNNRAIVTNGTGATACEGTTVNSFIAGGVLGTTGPYYYSMGNATGGIVMVDDATLGTFTFTPTPGFTGDAEFQYNVNATGPGLPQFCPASPSGIWVIPYVQNPVASNATIAGCAGSNVTGTLVPFVTGGSGSYTFSEYGVATCGSVTVNPDGTYSYTAPTGVGICTFEYEATDNTPPNCTGVGMVTVKINLAPIVFPQTIGTCMDMPVSGTVTAAGGVLPYTFSYDPLSQVNGMVTFFDPTTGDFTFTPTSGFTGVASFNYSVTDANGCPPVAPATITIIVSTPPVTATGMFTGCEGTTFTGSLTGLVSGGAMPYTFAQTGGTTGGSVIVNADGTFSFSPYSQFFTGIGSFQYVVGGSGCTGATGATVNIDFEAAPVATGANLSVCTNGTLTGNLQNYLISPPFGPNINFMVVTLPANGTLTLNTTTGAFTYVPNPGYSGPDSFQYEVIDISLSCPSAIETISITVNPLPVVATGAILACAGSPVNGNLNGLVSGQGPFTFVSNGSVVNGTVVIQPSGLFTFTPAGVGPGSFGFIVTSFYGCTAAGTENVTVNASPTAASGANLACGGVPVTGALDPLVSGGNPPYTFAVGGPVNGTVTVNPVSGIYTFTPSKGVTGGSFVYTAYDSNNCFATGLISMSVNPGPQSSNGAFTGCENFPIINTLTGLVTGGVPPLDFFETGPMPTCGIVGVNPNGTFTFIPDPNFVGSCSFQYQVVDSGTPSCESAVSTVQVTFEDGPTLLPGTFNICENTTYTGTLTNLIFGGFPPYTFFATGAAPTCGTVTVNPNGSFVFVPNLDFVGSCIFSYQAEDSTPCLSNIATGTVNVHPTPVAANTGPLNICENTKATGNLNPLMSVGTPPYTFSVFDPVNGSVTVNTSGIYSFNPTPNYTGPASFDYDATDSFGCVSNTAIVSFLINAAPVITSLSPLTTCENVPVSGTVTTTGGTPPYTFFVVSTAHGTVTAFDTATGAFTFTPAAGFVGNASLTIGVSDSLGCSSKVMIIVKVKPSPTVQSTGVDSCQDVVFGNLNSLVSGGTPPYTFTEVGTITCGAVTVNPNGSFVYTGPAGYTGPCTFDFVVTDVNGCSNTGAFTIMMTATGAPVAMDGSFCACFNTPVTGNLNSLVSGGVPPYQFIQVGTVIGGTLLLNSITGQFTFLPAVNFIGTASFQFVAVDSSNVYCQSNIATVTISVPCCFGATAVTGVA